MVGSENNQLFFDIFNSVLNVFPYFFLSFLPCSMYPLIYDSVVAPRRGFVQCPPQFFALPPIQFRWPAREISGWNIWHNWSVFFALFVYLVCGFLRCLFVQFVGVITEPATPHKPPCRPFRASIPGFISKFNSEVIPKQRSSLVRRSVSKSSTHSPNIRIPEPRRLLWQ